MYDQRPQFYSLYNTFKTLETDGALEHIDSTQFTPSFKILINRIKHFIIYGEVKPTDSTINNEGQKYMYTHYNMKDFGKSFHSLHPQL